MSDNKDDFYQRLRKQFKDWLRTKEGKTNKYSEYLMFAPDFFHLLVRLAMDPEVPVSEKSKLAIAIAYFVSPIDLIPEGIVGPAGYIDDIALSAYVLNSIVNKTGPEIVEKHWAGEGDVLNAIKEVLKVADDMLGAGLWKKIKKML